MEGAVERHREGALEGFFWMTDEDYHDPFTPGISSTWIKHILRSPAHYKSARENPETSDAMIFGRQVHEMLFQPEKFSELYIKGDVNPFDGRTKEGREWREKWTARIGSKTEIDPVTWDLIYGIVDSVWAKRAAAAVLDGAQFELAAFHRDPETGLTLKCKVDAIRDWCISDLKTCQDARPEAFIRDARKYRYHVSAAYYMDICNALGTKVDSFVWIAAEKKRPHGVWCYAATEQTLDLGRKEYKKALKTLKDCTTNQHWGCYSEEITELEFTPWQLKELYE